MVQVDIAIFWDCDFFQVVQSSILGVVISFLIVKTPLLCSTDVKLSSVQHHSVSLSTYIHFTDSALSTLISAQHSDQHWTDLSGPLLSPFGWGRMKANTDQHWSEHVGQRQDLLWLEGVTLPEPATERLWDWIVSWNLNIHYECLWDRV